MGNIAKGHPNQRGSGYSLILKMTSNLSISTKKLNIFSSSKSSSLDLTSSIWTIMFSSKLKVFCWSLFHVAGQSSSYYDTLIEGIIHTSHLCD